MNFVDSVEDSYRNLIFTSVCEIEMSSLRARRMREDDEKEIEVTKRRRRK